MERVLESVLDQSVARQFEDQDGHGSRDKSAQLIAFARRDGDIGDVACFEYVRVCARGCGWSNWATNWACTPAGNRLKWI